MHDYSMLEALHRIIEVGSFGEAARSLYLTQPAISQKIRQLELRVGAPLLVRTKPVTPTELGQKLLHHFEKVRALEWDLDLVPKNKKSLLFPVAVNAESLSTWFLPTLQSFPLPLLPQIQVRDQDKTLELLQRGLVLACVSAIEKTVSGCVSHSLGQMNYVCVATPKYISKWFPNGANRGSLEQAPAAIYGKEDRLHEQYLRGIHRKFETVVPPYLFVPSPEGLVTATLTSMGYGVLPKRSVQRHLEKGKLVEVFPNSSYKIPLFWHVVDIRSDWLQKLTSHITKASCPTDSPLNFR